MKTSTYCLLAAAALTFGMPASDALAQDRPDEARPGQLQLGPQLPAGTAARYRVTYANSQTRVAALRSASIVSITNQSTVTCRVAVDWNFGAGGIACSANLVITPGMTADFCTRPIPGAITSCNSTCPGAGLTFFEGNATVGSSTIAGCEKIAVSARTVYTASTTDSPVSAITDAKVVKIGSGNIGD